MSSDEPSPNERLFQSFHVGLQSRWNEDQFYTLCSKLNNTPFELAALVGLTRGQLKTYIKSNKFPIPVCRHLHNIDRWLDLKRGKKLEPDPMDMYINEC